MLLTPSHPTNAGFQDGQQPPHCGHPAWMGLPHAGMSSMWMHKEHLRAISSATVQHSGEVVTHGQGVLPHSEQPHRAGERGNFVLSPHLGTGHCTGKGRCLNWPQCLNWPETAHFPLTDTEVWAAQSSSVWGVLWALLGNEGANLLGGSTWIQIGFEWEFSVLPFPSLTAALRLLHPWKPLATAFSKETYQQYKRGK